MGSNLLRGAADDNFRHIDVAQPEGSPIGSLPIGRCLAGKWVLPIEIIPIIHVKRDRKHIVTCRDLTEQPIRGRPGRAALRCKEFYHGLAGTRQSGALYQHSRDCRSLCYFFMNPVMTVKFGRPGLAGQSIIGDPTRIG